MIKNFILVAVGGALGSVLRYATALIIGSKAFPVATLLINILGSFVIGWVIAISMRNEDFANNWKPLLATGLCGGFTTFSAFSLESLQLFQNGKYTLALGYIILSVFVGILAAFAGFRIFRA